MIELTPITNLEYEIQDILDGELVENPITRIEQMLEDISNYRVVRFAPITRIEQYLANISGYGNAIPQPFLRIEFYLAAICGMNVILPTPETRLEYLLLDWYEHNEETITIAGEIATFIAQKAVPFKKIEVSFEPVQSGTGDPSPTNVRPITGYTGAKIAVTSANLVEITAQSAEINGVTFTVNGDGTISTSGTATAVADFEFGLIKNPLLGVRYKLTGCPQGGSINDSYSIVDRYSRLADVGNGSTNTYVSTLPTRPLRIRVVSGTNMDGLVFKPMVQFADYAVDEFEVYSGRILNISWQDEAGTVYGGTLTINEDGSVDLVVNKVGVDLGSLSWTTKATGTNHKSVHAGLPSAYVGYPRTSENIFKAIAEDYTASNATYYSGNNDSKITNPDNYSVGYIYYSNNNNRTFYELYLILDVGDSPSGKIVYNIATPQTYHLASIDQLYTLVGLNNVWADIGDVSVTIPEYIDITLPIVGIGRVDYMVLQS